MYLPTVITHRPDAFQVDTWASRDGVPFRGHVLDPVDVDWFVWHGNDALLVDVADFDLLTRMHGARGGFVILLGHGELDDALMVTAWCTGQVNGASRMDRFDSRSALLAILDGFRKGQGAHLIEVLSRG